MCAFKGVLVVAVLFCISVNTTSASINPKIYRTINSFRKCLANGYPLLCVKEAGLQFVNDTLVNDKPMLFYDMIEIGKNPNYNITNEVDGYLPSDLNSRSIKLDEILHEKIENFFKSRTIKFIMAPAVEGEVGRKKGGGGGGKKGGMMMMGMVGMACMMGQMMMGKVAFMAGTALIMAKLALFLTAMMGMKKMGGGGGGGEAHVVYAAPAEHSHGGGGWHRSLEGDGTGYRYPDNAGGY